MNITESKVKFIKDGNVYTLLQKDENSKIKFHYDDDIINIATKQEVLDNLPNISYNDTAKIYYYLNGECVQLAVKEDIESPNAYELVFNNQEGFETSTNIERDNNFTTISLFNIKKTNSCISYNSSNVEFTYDDSICEAKDNCIVIATRSTDSNQVLIDYTSETELIFNSTVQDPLTGVKIDTTDLDESKIVYDLTGNANEEDYTLNNAAIQTFHSTLSYTEVEEV